jgi:hypothetical protein
VLKLNRPAAWLIAVCMAGYLLYGPVTLAIANVKSPPKREDIKPVMAYIAENYQNTDLIYVFYGAAPAFRFYAPAYGLDYNSAIVAASRDNVSQYSKDIDKLKGHPRVWFVFSFLGPHDDRTEEGPVLKSLDEIGTQKGRLIAEGASVYLYDLAQAP